MKIKVMKIKNLLLILFVSLVTIPARSDAQDTPAKAEFIDGIVALVNDGVVLQSELDSQTTMIIGRLQAGGVDLPPRDVLNEQILERLILAQIQLQRADRMGIKISDEMLNAALSRIAAQNGIGIDQLPEVLRAQGIDYAAYRREMREQLTLEQLRQIDVIGRIAVSPREVQQCLDRQIGNVSVNAEYDISHILIGVSESATSTQFAEAEQEAISVIEQLAGGASFAETAVSHSDAQTALEGGALGWRRGDQIPTLFSEVVGGLAPGEISDPIRSPSGFHIVRLNDVRGTVTKSEVNQTKIRHILVQINEVIDDQTAEQRLNDARTRILGGESFEELARLLSDDPGSATSGGEMGWTDPGTFVPEFEKVADALEIGDMSKPFKSRFGWHILEVQDRRVYDNTAEVRENNCAVSIRNSKVEEETELWLRRLRDDAFVDKRG